MCFWTDSLERIEASGAAVARRRSCKCAAAIEFISDFRVRAAQHSGSIYCGLWRAEENDTAL